MDRLLEVPVSFVPYRVTFLAPHLSGIPAGPLQYPAAFLVQHAVFEHLFRHRGLAVADHDDFHLLDGQGALLSCQHPKINNVKSYEIHENRRDEVLWLEVGQGVRLGSHRFRQEPQFFQSQGQANAELADAIANVIAQWLQARGLAAAPSPIERFGVGDLQHVAELAVRTLADNQNIPKGQSLRLPPPPVKVVLPFLHLLAYELNIGVERTILQVDPDNPWGLRDDHLTRWHQFTSDNKPGASRDDIRRAISLAPCWGKTHALMWGDQVPKPEQLHHLGVAATLLAANPLTITSYAKALYQEGRKAEAFHWANKAAKLAPFHIDSHLCAMDSLRDLGRDGPALLDIQGRLSLLGDLQKQGRFGGAEPLLCMARLTVGRRIS